MQLTSSIRVSVEFQGIVQDVQATFTFHVSLYIDRLSSVCSYVKSHSKRVWSYSSRKPGLLIHYGAVFTAVLCIIGSYKLLYSTSLSSPHLYYHPCQLRLSNNCGLVHPTRLATRITIIGSIEGALILRAPLCFGWTWNTLKTIQRTADEFVSNNEHRFTYCACSLNASIYNW